MLSVAEPGPTATLSRSFCTCPSVSSTSQPFKGRGTHRRDTNNTATMPVDFTSYLLSASPPGFDMCTHFSGAPGFGQFSERNNFQAPRMISSSVTTSENHIFSLTKSFVTNKIEPYKSCSKTNGEQVAKDIEKLVLSQSTRQSKMKKKVVFADDLGLALVAIKIMEEPSDTPPQLRAGFLSSLAMGAKAGVTEKPPLKLDFAQPASDYLAFRDRLEQNNVSLENVIIKDYSLMGTIRVKNISFEKKVIVRCTVDNWENCFDISATFVPNNPLVGTSTTTGRYDTFKFEINVPPSKDISKRVEFCVCYETNGEQFWDNNNGANYGVMSEDWKKVEDDSVFAFNYEREWSSFSSWSHIDSSVPYY